MSILAAIGKMRFNCSTFDYHSRRTDEAAVAKKIKQSY
ncbi:MAG: hypothetical protein RIS79_44 [Verrucomicrobiota bacterium]